MVGVRGRGRSIAAPTLAPTARHPGFTPAAFAGECFYDLYLAVDEGAEGRSAGADHADGEFELTVLLFVSNISGNVAEAGILTSRLRCSRGCK